MKPRSTDPWFVKKLIALDACPRAIQYARKHRTFAAAWNNCEYSRWLVWLLETILEFDSCPKYCVYCNWDRTEEQILMDIRRRFPADRVSKALRKV